MRDQTQRKFIRINAGILKGLGLKLPSDTTTRPSKAILRESALNSLQDILREVIFIEVFAGSGGVGISALSHGANGAIFIEKSQEAFLVLKDNVSRAKELGDFKTECFNGDSFALLGDLVSRLDSKFALFLDPPFPKSTLTNAHGEKTGEYSYERLLEMLKLLDLKNCEVMVFEIQSKALRRGVFPDQIQDFSIIKTKLFGASALVHYRKMQ